MDRDMCFARTITIKFHEGNFRHICVLVVVNPEKAISLSVTIDDVTIVGIECDARDAALYSFR